MSGPGMGKCAACGTATPPGRLMCCWHWRQVPPALQRDVWGAWKAFQYRRDRFGGLRRLGEYRMAADAAAEYVRSIQP